jgi:hypothetical protein
LYCEHGKSTTLKKKITVLSPLLNNFFFDNVLISLWLVFLICAGFVLKLRVVQRQFVFKKKFVKDMSVL